MAQVIKKRKIVIASVLKPVDDTRIFEKIAQTLASFGNSEVHIIAYPTLKQRPFSGISRHPHKRFRRLSFYRLTVPWRIFLRIVQLKPDVLIVTTHELLLTGLLAKLFTDTRLIYDVQENYFRNILYMKSFPFLLRPFLAAYVRFSEIIAAPFVDQFLLSENCYQKELPFLGNRFTVIQNKVLKEQCQTEARKMGSGAKVHFLFSGTLAESTGVFTAIELIKKLHAMDNRIHLTIIGYCSTTQTLNRIRQDIEEFDFIKLIGGNELVPHQEIINAIQQCDAGIIAYRPDKATEDKIPTKLFEYIGNRLPIVLTNYAPWVQLCERYPAAVVFDPDRTDINQLYNELMILKFYAVPPSEEVYWESEVKTLTDIVLSL